MEGLSYLVDLDTKRILYGDSPSTNAAGGSQAGCHCVALNGARLTGFCDSASNCGSELCAFSEWKCPIWTFAGNLDLPGSGSYGSSLHGHGSSYGSSTYGSNNMALPACVDPCGFDAGYGGCHIYAGSNFQYCAEDRAERDCAECGKCFQSSDCGQYGSNMLQQHSGSGSMGMPLGGRRLLQDPAAVLPTQRRTAVPEVNVVHNCQESTIPLPLGKGLEPGYTCLFPFTPNNASVSGEDSCRMAEIVDTTDPPGPGTIISHYYSQVSCTNLGSPSLHSSKESSSFTILPASDNMHDLLGL